jgi:hypothetical protein
MKKVSVERAVGMVLGHDVTKIVPGTFKGPGFKRGHVIRREDIPELLKLGKEHIYVMKLRKGELHEDEAAQRLSQAFSGPGIDVSGPSEGKMKLTAQHAGLLSIDVKRLERINAQRGIALSTLHDHTPVKKGQMVAATRVIPLVISEQEVLKVEIVCEKGAGKVVSVLPYQRKDVGVLVTGNEIYRGRIKDRFDDYVGVKVRRYGSRIIKKIVAPDDEAFIARSMMDLVRAESNLILVTAGLSVDPDDVTLKGVMKAGARVVSYGSPVMPGSMFLYAYLDRIPVLGLPACVFHHATTVFDLVFPRVLADQKITRRDIVQLGHGGLCLECATCRYPICPFGKG